MTEADDVIAVGDQFVDLDLQLRPLTPDALEELADAVAPPERAALGQDVGDDPVDLLAHHLQERRDVAAAERRIRLVDDLRVACHWFLLPWSARRARAPRSLA